jgi:hypothetical protein
LVAGNSAADGGSIWAPLLLPLAAVDGGIDPRLSAPSILPGGTADEGTNQQQGQCERRQRRWLRGKQQHNQNKLPPGELVGLRCV